MIYDTAEAWRRAPKKRVLLFAMSGLGKTHVSALLRESRNWFHYSIDYRIGTHYMGEYITDNAKAEAMQVPFLRELLLSDSIYIGSNVTFHNLGAVSAYLGKPGDPAKGGLDIDTYRQRQSRFARAETQALLDTPYFIERAEALYGYPHFVCDTGGSFCEWVDPEDPEDPILSVLDRNCLMIWIEGSDAHTEELVRRFDRDPKPMAYSPDFLDREWNDYLVQMQVAPDKVDPDAFIRWTYAQALSHRQPLYAAIARNWGVTVAAEDMARVRDAADFDDVVAAAIDSAPSRR
ncbi:hypothetical protein ROJ8625_01762 [Roseivivax jejudonensis]|uniref:ATPase n=1 Tax=Roseivivax jejudonensis TaxID=1529041 RepID=A0A1X6Z2L2_9RHOB|nr:ATPase [Roseivivax jejudonensis]SLN38383.1 hypothetical protein ROJ8625_01762 [Roseivivax jejudonensis]